MGGICCCHVTGMLVQMGKWCMPNFVVIILFKAELWPFVSFYSKSWAVLGWQLPWAISEWEMFYLILLKLYVKVICIRTLYTHTQNLLRNDLFWQALYWTVREITLRGVWHTYIYYRYTFELWPFVVFSFMDMEILCPTRPTPVICYIYIFYLYPFITLCCIFPFSAVVWTWL